MADEQQTTQQPASRRGGGQKPFPTLSFEESLVIAQTIRQEGISDQLRRLTLFNRLAGC